MGTCEEVFAAIPRARDAVSAVKGLISVVALGWAGRIVGTVELVRNNDKERAAAGRRVSVGDQGP